MIVSINQPCYFGWLGYFDRIRRSDLHIVLDHVQLEKGSYTNRCRIKQRDGREMWLTIPVEKGKPINQTRIIGDGWRRKHREAMAQAYGLMFRYPEIDSLFDTLLPLTDHLLREFRIRTPVEFSATLGGDRLGTKSELVLNLLRQVGATTYLSGPYGRDYLDIPSFERAGIEVVYHDFPHGGDLGLSVVHHIFNPKGFTWPQPVLTSVRSSPRCTVEAECKAA